MSESWTRVVGDTNDTLTAQLDGIDTIPVGTTVEAHIGRTTDPVSSTTLTATVVDAAARTVRVLLGSWLTTAAPGVWSLEIQVTGTWADGQIGPRTWGPRRLTLRSQIG